ncbi:MAG: sulfatase-like hydrolase/transferase [Rickettsiales bacterium]|jgi:heptose-I-phosphate ethanolaminephosphotransferase|nr:sulfatase-like hydrolase/transferase [Rickettsiales bacterium]
MQDVNVFLVYGESYSWHQSSLFGWKDKTSPLLEQFAEEDKRFKYKDGVSCAVFTATSIPSFFNMYMDPENFREQITKTGNLFSIAKRNNWTTYWLSIQSTSLINNLNVGDIDHISHYNNEKALIDEFEDDATLKFLKRYDLEKDGSNFMVLHQGNMHSPFLQYRTRHPEFKVFENEYENAQLYEDYLIYNILTHLKTLKKPTFFFLISDHGSGGGFNGNYGNLSLDAISSDVPVMMWTNFDEKNITDKFDKMWKPHCHQLGSLIMEIMGYKLINPNQEKGVYYVNGTDLFGRHGYTKITKDEENRTIKYENISP